MIHSVEEIKIDLQNLCCINGLALKCFSYFMDKALEADSESDFESILNNFVEQGK